MVTIRKEGEIEITLPDEDVKTKPEDVDKAASPPTIEMVLARLDQIDSKINENSEALKALKQAPKPPKEDEEKEKKPVDEKKKVDEKPTEDIVEKKEEKIDVVALIKSIVDEKVSEKLGDQPIQKRSTAPPEPPKKIETPMDIPAEIFAKADPESILRMGGYTTKRR